MICAICQKEIEGIEPIILRGTLPPILKMRGDEIHVAEEHRDIKLHAHPECWETAYACKATWMSSALKWKGET